MYNLCVTRELQTLRKGENLKFKWIYVPKGSKIVRISESSKKIFKGQGWIIKLLFFGMWFVICDEITCHLFHIIYGVWPGIRLTCQNKPNKNKNILGNKDSVTYIFYKNNPFT